ncbi:MAG: ATP-binding protein, partial [Syntrophales bacterium]
MEQSQSYGASDIKILEGLEAVRKRPAMYIGSTDKSGLHHLVYEVLDNSIDEALAGYCKEINIIFTADGAVSVEDDGRGIPIDIIEEKGISAVEVVLTILHAGGKFGGQGYKVSGGLHGVGVSCVNALSQKLFVETYREGKQYTQWFTRGNPDAPGKVITTGDKKTGTKIVFYPDTTIFETTDFDFGTIAMRCKELAYLNKGLKICVVDERSESIVKEDYQFEGGIVSYIKAIDASKEPLFKEPFYIHKSKDDTDVEIALHYSRNYYDEHLISFVNNIKTREGGTHVVGFRTALTRSLNLFAKKYKLFKGDEILTGNDT